MTALLIADSQAQSEAARKSDKDASGVDIVVQGALDSELQPLLAALEGKEQIQIAACTFWRGRVGGKRVVGSRTEVGPINAVAATTLAIVNFKPKLIIKLRCGYWQKEQYEKRERFHAFIGAQALDANLQSYPNNGAPR